MRGRVILRCVSERGKLRIRFDSYIDAVGKRWRSAYDPNLNCRFPRGIRAEGLYYEIPEENLTLSSGRGAAYFYMVRNHNITFLNEDDLPDPEVTRIFSAEECVICLDSGSEVAFLPCGHKCTCRICSPHVQKCPLCRREILQRTE